jgi:hypothetical protein
MFQRSPKLENQVEVMEEKEEGNVGHPGCQAAPMVMSQTDSSTSMSITLLPQNRKTTSV